MRVHDFYELSPDFKIFERVMLNWIKEKFIKVWVPKALFMIREQSRVNIGEDATLIQTGPIVLNDDDVNKIFGWAMFKVRKRYMRNQLRVMMTFVMTKKKSYLEGLN